MPNRLVFSAHDCKTWVAVFEVESEAEARQLLTVDPAVGAKIVTAELRPWLSRQWTQTVLAVRCYQ